MKRAHSLAKLLSLIVMSLATTALAQKTGGTLRMPLNFSPSSASLLEESSIYALRPFMPVFNNLVVYDEQEKVARQDTIRPDLATAWSWSPDHKVLTMKLRQADQRHLYAQSIGKRLDGQVARSASSLQQ